MTFNPGDTALGYLEKHHKVCKADSGAIKFRVTVSNSATFYLLNKECPHEPMYKIKLCENGTLSDMSTRDENIDFIIPNFYDGEFQDIWLTWYNNKICMGLLNQPPFLEFKERNRRSSKQIIGFIHFVTMYDRESNEWDILSSSDDLHFYRPMQPPKPIEGGKLRWVKMAQGDPLPTDALIGGFESEPLYVARASHRGSLAPGKYVKSSECAYIPWGHEEFPKTEFEVLCGYDAIWQKCALDQIPENAFIGGKSEVRDEPLYIGRAWIQNHLIPGKVHTLYKNCYIPYKGKELSSSVYEILVTPYKPTRGYSCNSLCYKNMNMQPCVV